jgi:uncharacterized repeat protein (TIGR03803 family)
MNCHPERSEGSGVRRKLQIPRVALLAVFSLLPIAARPAHAQTETVLYSFTGGSDGRYPEGRLTSDGSGNFYGATTGGGLGSGTVFELSPNGGGGWSETVLHSFTGGLDGGTPYYSYVIFDSAGNLYGTASQGGAYGDGVVFQLSPAGTNWTETVLYNFESQSGGGHPQNGLIFDSSGNLYGMNSAGVFELSPSDGEWTEQVIYETETGSYAGLAISAGKIFGVGMETIFELSPNGDGGWTPTVIHTFTGYPTDGLTAESAPVPDNKGNLYGTTLAGGAYGKAHGGYGTVYKLSPGEEGWTEEILHSFKGEPTDGSGPWDAVSFDTVGNIYGTTILGGTSRVGTVFELAAPIGTGSYQEKVLWNFNISDGDGPYGGLILDDVNNLYGTTIAGDPRQGAGCGGYGCGIVFEVAGVFEASSTTLASSPNPSTDGEAVTFSAIVTSNAGPPPDGEIVSFMNGKTLLGTGALSGGSASFTTSALKVGKTAVTAAYGGDSKLLGSKSAPVKQVVNKAGK